VPFFAGRTGRRVRIAILDSGVHAAHPHVGGVAGGVAILPDGGLGGDFVDRLGHGTAVAAAIREKAPDADLVAVKIFEGALRTDAGTLVRAIDWAIADGAHAINLSLGTPNEQHAAALAAAVARAGNTIIVAAREHDAVRWFPGSLPGVIPVLLDWATPRDEYGVERLAGGSTAFRTSGYPRAIPGVPPERNLRGISFAVANMTGFVARALEAHPGATVAELAEALAVEAVVLRHE
jgi:subtilisin family serine protease